MSLPLVSCIMPTYGRPDYVAESIAMFLAQDYPRKELLILNDCPGQTLTGNFPGIRIINAPSRWPTLGEKRNAAIELAKGDYIAVWDDDDVYFPWRLSASMQCILETNAAIYCPAEYWAYWGDENLHENQAILSWIYHPVLMFTKSVWRAVAGYPAQTMCEDTAFVNKTLQHLGIAWPHNSVARHDRPMILRGKSEYVHTSISGGRRGPDTEPRMIPLEPRRIADPILRAAAERLIKLHHETAVTQIATREWACIEANTSRCWLDKISPQHSSVGFGTLGVQGELGYEGKRVEACGQNYVHALSAHAPSQLVYELDGTLAWFGCRVALNDDVPSDATAADFKVFADGRRVAFVRNVRPGESPRRLMADIQGARLLELVVQPWRGDYCHSVWLDPFLIKS